jgi:hypothetical protein
MGTVDSLTPISARRLNSENQNSVDLYLEAFHRYADDHHIWERVAKLKLLSSRMTSDQCKDCFDSIDRDITRAMLHAEKRPKDPRENTRGRRNFEKLDC